jgi:hypothetical protein
MLQRLTVLAIVLMVGSTNAATACKGGQVLLEDWFSSTDAAWGRFDNTKTVENSRLIMVADPELSQTALNTGYSFENADVCVGAVVQQDPIPGQARASLVFWAKDYSNMFLFSVLTDGKFEVERLIQGQWQSPAVISWTKTEALKKGVGQINILRARIEDNFVRLFINDKEVASFKGQSPDAPWKLGLSVGGGKGGGTGGFIGLKVTSVKE